MTRARAGVLALAVFLSGCSGHGAAELAGSYEANYPFGTARLILETDGDFRETMTLTGQEPKPIATGRWSYDANAARLTLSNFSEIAYPNGLPVPDDLMLNGPTTIPVVWSTTPLTLHLGAGEGTPFRRVP